MKTKSKFSYSTENKDTGLNTEENEIVTNYPFGNFEKEEPEAVKKYVKEIDETVVIFVQKLTSNYESTYWPEGVKGPIYFFYGETKDEAIGKAFQYAVESYLGE